jgi:serine/threonine-protein kinase HipA
MVGIAALVGRSGEFALSRSQALAVLGEVVAAAARWREIAMSPEVGLSPRELESFAPAFEHSRLVEARRLAE